MAAPPLAPKKGRSPVFWIGLGCCGCLALVLVFVGLVGGVAVFATRGAVEAARAQITAIKPGNIDAAPKPIGKTVPRPHTQAEIRAVACRHPASRRDSEPTVTT